MPDKRIGLIAGILGLTAALAGILYFNEPWLHLDSAGRGLYQLFIPWEERIELINKPRVRMGVGDGIELIPFSEEFLFVESVDPVRLNIVRDSFLPDRAIATVNRYVTLELQEERSGHYSYRSEAAPVILTIQVLSVDLEG